MLKGKSYYNQSILDFTETIIKSKKPQKEQLRDFFTLTNKTRRTFFRYKKYLISLKPELAKYSLKQKVIYSNNPNKESCYFCPKPFQIIHHIDMNNKNNIPSNRLPLCRVKRGCLK